MGNAYKKSIDAKYKKYFEQIQDLVKPFNTFSINDGSISISETSRKKPWEYGTGGIPLAWNKKENYVAIDQTDAHTLVVGPTGSKKSRLVVMPLVRVLASAGESMIISDPKAEIFNRTASYLAERNYNIFVLNLRSPMHGKRWNPLTIPYDFFLKGEVDKAYEFVNDIAENLINSEKAKDDPFWDNSAGSFFFGLVLLLFKYCKDYGIEKEYVHIGNVIELRKKLISENGRGKQTNLWAYAKQDPIISSALIGTVETASDTRAGILSVFDQKMRMFSIQPNLLDMLSENDIDFSLIGTSPTAVYVIVPDEKTGYHGLVSLFIKQSYEFMIHNAQTTSDRDGFHVGILKNRVNYVLDEFSSLPTIRDFPAMITAARSRNIRFTLVIQSKHQLIQRYREETETIQTNCNNWVFLSSREMQLLEEISSLCGNVTTEDFRPLLPVTMLQRLDKDEGEALLLCGRLKPCITILPDIENYDKNRYAQKQVEMRRSKDVKWLDFEKPNEEAKAKMDELKAEFDKRLEELEKEIQTSEEVTDS